MAKVGISQFVTQVRQEASKVTWSTKREVTVSTIMVLVMVSIAAVFFLLVDIAAFNSVQFILGLGS